MVDTLQYSCELILSNKKQLDLEIKKNELLEILFKTFPEHEDRLTFYNMVKSMYKTNCKSDGNIYLHYINNGKGYSCGATVITSLLRELFKSNFNYYDSFKLNDYILNNGFPVIFRNTKYETLNGLLYFDDYSKENEYNDYNKLNLNNRILESQFKNNSFNILVKDLNRIKIFDSFQDNETLKDKVKIINYRTYFNINNNDKLIKYEKENVYSCKADYDLKIKDYVDAFKSLFELN
jgi:hypothetical protein